MAYISKEKVALIRKELRKLAKEHNLKISVTSGYNANVSVIIKEGNIDFLNEYIIYGNEIQDEIIRKIYKENPNITTSDEFYKYLDKYISGVTYAHMWYNNYCVFAELNKEFYIQGAETAKFKSPEVQELMDKMVEIIKTKGEHYDNSDAMIDYFDYAFIYNINIGAWDTPYKFIKGK